MNKNISIENSYKNVYVSFLSKIHRFATRGAGSVNHLVSFTVFAFIFGNYVRNWWQY